MHISFNSITCISRRLAIAALLLLVSCVGASAQSTNIEFPTPVTADELSGVIEARDVGDPRLTRHFYILTATQGDLILTVESSNLNGDVDLFTSGSLRPLTKLSMYAGLSTSSVTKSVYLRARESLILRVEARSSNDEAGRYHIRFSGGFEPIANATPPPENVEPTVSSSSSRDKNVRRVTATGARIKEEEPVAKVEPPEPAPAPKVKAKKTKPETTAPPEEPAPVKPKTPRTARPARAKTPARTPSRRQPATAAKKREEPAKTTDAAAPPPATTPAEPAINPRLIIETRDGMRVERYMSEVRRVTVEKGLLIVITSDGKVERRPMTNVLRVTIEP